MIIVIGEILIDHFPEYERIGGAPFNFAFHLKNMGWPVQFITRIGDDADGLKIRQMLEAKDFDPQDLQVDKTHPTGRVEVTLDDKGVPQYYICENVAYDHMELTSLAVGKGVSADMIYYGTLIQRTDSGRDQVQHFLKNRARSATCFCDINFRDAHINMDAIEPSLYHADILKLNDEELEKVSTMCKGPTQPADAVNWLMQRYNIAQIALTHGADGSTAFKGDKASHCPPVKIPLIKDTVGAGDAYAAVLAVGMLKNLPVERTLELATVFAGRICGLPGAIPKDKQVYHSLKNDFERMLDAQ